MSKKDTFNINVRTRMPEEVFRIKDHESDEESADVVTPLQKEEKRKKRVERRKQMKIMMSTGMSAASG